MATANAVKTAKKDAAYAAIRSGFSNSVIARLAGIPKGSVAAYKAQLSRSFVTTIPASTERHVVKIKLNKAARDALLAGKALDFEVE